MDAPRSAKTKKAAGELWKEWNGNREQNAIFWDFIVLERNKVLKEGRFGAAPEPVYLVDEDGAFLTDDDGSLLTLEQNYFRMLLEGLEDKDGLDLVAAAVDWWSEQLNRIEAKLIE